MSRFVEARALDQGCKSRPQVTRAALSVSSASGFASRRWFGQSIAAWTVAPAVSLLSASLFAVCADAAEVRIVSVEYKGPHKGRDFTANGILNCRGQQVCDFSCNNGTYGDVEAGQLKVCFIKYSCGTGPTLERTVLEHPDRYSNLLDCREK